MRGTYAPQVPSPTIVLTPMVTPTATPMNTTVSAESPRKTTTVEAVFGKAALFGVAGWVGENFLYGPRYSPVFQGHKVPFLPVYSAGGLAVIAAAPHLAKQNVVLRGIAYAAMGTVIEYAGCQVDRRVFDGRSWDYGKIDGLAERTDGCISWRHAALWGALGLVAGKFA